MKFGSLFAGIGGIDLGLERAGMECAWQVEIDDYCTRVLEKHWPSVRRYRNVREVGSNLEPVDLIAGGFPCQPHSVAGKRKGAADDRNLWPEFVRVIRDTKPRYVLAENVPGIITTYLDTVLSDLEGEGYTCTTFNIPACGFDAPHRRERIFVVAYNTNGSREDQIKGMATRNSANAKRVRGDVAYAESRKSRESSKQEGRKDIGGGSEEIGYVADTDRTRTPQSQGSKQEKRGRSVNGSQAKNVADTQDTNRRPSETKYPRGWHPEARGCGIGRDRETYWTIEPDVGRVAHGIPSRVDRLRGLGNAVVPQVTEWIGRRIMEYDQGLLKGEQR